MIEFSCPHCGRPMRVDDSAAGKRGKCKGCEETVTVPSPQAADVDAIAVIEPRTVTSSTRPRPQAPQHLAPAAPPVAIQVNVPTPSKSSNSFGIAALVLGVVAIFVCWLPFFSFPIAGLGLLLGLGGVFVAMTRRGSGLGFSIAGSILCMLVLIATGVFMLAVGAGVKAISDVADAANTEKKTASAAYAASQKREDDAKADMKERLDKLKHKMEPQDADRERQGIPSGNSGSPSPSEANPEKRVTKAHFDEIKEGMTYAEVVKIIGVEGEEMASSSIEGVPGVMAGISTKVYMWKNWNGANMNATFQNDQLKMKAQFGLR